MHYSSSGQVPFVVGVDGVGRLENGRRVYFFLPRAPFGSMSEQTVVGPSHYIPVPDGVDDITAAAIANPGMSAWAALRERAKVAAGEKVLVNGATGTAGRLAVQIAKYMGASKVVATGRNKEVLASLAALGADSIIPLSDGDEAFEEALKEQFGGEGIDIVLDYLWGNSAERIIGAAAKAGRPLRFVQIGAASASNITLPGTALRSSAIELMGSGIGSVPTDRLVKSIDELMRAVIPGGFQIDTQTFPLSEVENVWWITGDSRRTVFQIP